MNIELLREKAVSQAYDILARELLPLRIAVPKACIARFLMERAAAGATNDDPILPARVESPPVSLFNEIMDDLPCKMRPPPQFIRDDAGAARLARSLYGCAQALGLRLPEPPETLEQLADYIATIRPIVIARFTPDVTRVCDIIVEHFDRAQRGYPAPKYGKPVTVTTAGDITTVSGYGHAFKLYRERAEKLERQFSGGKRGAPKFEQALIMMLLRYSTYFGKQDEAVGMHGGLPRGVFAALTKWFDVTAECFASPLNCYYDQYCSAFYDTDYPFGSLGPFQEYDFSAGGSFEANPPFSEEFMDRAVDHMIRSLATPAPLQFIIFVPDWQHPPSAAIERMKAHATFSVSIPPEQHVYVTGHQHGPETFRKDGSILYRPPHSSNLILLQNAAAAKKWPKELARKIVEAWGSV
jgi:hypothetical protein